MCREFEEAHGDSGFHDHRHGPAVNLSDGKGVVRFPSAVATMERAPTPFSSASRPRTGETFKRMKGVVATHLDRFAFREAPLPFN
jgi:hypothetical protein